MKLGTILVGLGLLGMTSLLGCAEAAPPTEEKAMTTARLLRPHAAAELPASGAEEFTTALGGPSIGIEGWEGYVAGTNADDLLLLHFSGVANARGVAGLSIAIVENTRTSGNLEARLRNASAVEVRFHDGSGLVSRHDFGSSGQTIASHRANDRAKALLGRAFNDAEALLRLPVEDASGGDEAQACAASFLATVSSAARCVDDAANTADCKVVRDQAVLVAAHCEGAPTANVLLGTKNGGVRTAAFGLGVGGGNIFQSNGFFPLGGGTSFGSLLGGGLGGGNPLGSIGMGLFRGMLGSFLGGNRGFSGIGNSFVGGFPTPIFGQSSFAPRSFGNDTLFLDDDTGFVSREPIFF